MALQVNLALNITFVNSFDASKYINLLTLDQISEIQNPINKIYTIDGIYAKIGTLTGDKNNINLRLDLYRDSTKATLLESRAYTFTPNLLSSDNFIKQGYEYLKTIAEYKDATDLLDE